MMSRGDRIIIETPGGGGWGAPASSKDESDRSSGDKAGLLHTGLLKGSLVERVANQLGV
jgi:N-methylhydantoinase B/oxoprolinase/acetone carboxylase alpha subunit